MKKFTKIISVILAALMCTSLFSSCSKQVDSTPVKIDDFRVTAYLVADTLNDKDFDATHFNQVTDIIFFGCATFDENGKITLSDNFNSLLAKLEIAINADSTKRIYLNILGPDSQTDSDDWNEQMADKGARHTKAFESGNLQKNIIDVVDKYGFDGVFFDYEFPMKGKNWKPFSSFLVSLNNSLGEDKKIGVALASWDLKLSAQAKDAVDMVEVMSYDLWDDNGAHATMDIAKDDIDKFVKAGYDKAKLDLGLPFYARPTTEESYWYNYKDYADKIDKDGYFDDKDETKLKFSFNTPELIKEKTQYAIDQGLGGMMVWHYSCDTPSTSDNSLFNTIANTIKEAQDGSAQ